MKIFVGDVGTSIRVRLVDECGEPIDISTTTSQRIAAVSEQTGDTPKVFTAGLLTDGVDGWIEYLTVAGDFDVAGTWKLQAHVVFPASEFYSEIGSVQVHQRLFA